MKLLLIEEDPFWQTKMQLMLQELNLCELTICDNLSSAKSLLKESIPELIISDVILNNETVFDLLVEKEYQSIPVLFITNSENIDLYNLSKIIPNAQYLIKPFHKITLLSAIEKLKKLSENINSNDSLGFMVKGAQQEKIFLKSSQIIYIKSELNYCVIKTSKNQFALKGSLINIKKILGEEIIQIHKTYLVNKNYILKANMQQMKVETECGIFPIGRIFKTNVLKLLEEKVDI